MEPSSCYFCYTNMLVCFCSGHNTTLSYTEVQLSMLKKKVLLKSYVCFIPHTMKHNMQEDKS